MRQVFSCEFGDFLDRQPAAPAGTSAAPPPAAMPSEPPRRSRQRPPATSSTRRPTPTPPAPGPRRRPCCRRRPPLQQAAVLRPPGRDQLLHGQPAAHGLPAVSVVRSADRQRGQSRGPARNVVANPPRPRSRLTDRYHSDGMHPRRHDSRTTASPSPTVAVHRRRTHEKSPADGSARAADRRLCLGRLPGSSHACGAGGGGANCHPWRIGCPRIPPWSRPWKRSASTAAR